LNDVTGYDVPAGLFGSDHWRYTVEPGTYTAEKEDDLGTYFRADGYPVTINGGATNLTWTHAGGIWVPRDSSKSPRIYYYQDERRPTGLPENPGLVYTAIVNAEAGKIHLAFDAKDAAFATTVRAGLRRETP
jgi:hypothetical protein